jgi:pyridoxine 4-dehydrogenase
VTPEQIEEARRIVAVASVQNRYSLADRRNEETLKFCEQQGVGFLPWYPMSGGKMLKSESPAGPRLAEIAARHSVSVAQVSIAWLLQRSPVMLPISGTSKVEHLEENVAATSLKLSAEEWADVEAAVS